MADIIWGNVTEIVSPFVLRLQVTHQKDGNSQDYAESEDISMRSVDIHAIPDNPSERRLDEVRQHLDGRFVKCEIEGRDKDGNLVAAVSHSGQGGY